MRFIGCLVLTFIVAAPAFADITGNARVIDGDTLEVEAGSDWRFDRKRFLKWWNSKEKAPSPSAYEVRSRGAASSGRARPPSDTLEQALAASKKRLKEAAARERLKWGPRK